MTDKIARLQQLMAEYPEPWLIEKEPHNYNDGTKEFTHVRYRHTLDGDGVTVSIGEYVTPDLAELLILLREVASTLPDEIERYKVWVDDLQSEMYVNCVYCGHRYGPRETTPVTMADALKAHVATCPKHPMAALVKAASTAADALLNADPGNPKDETGWASDESREAWVALHDAIATVQP